MNINVNRDVNMDKDMEICKHIDAELLIRRYRYRCRHKCRCRCAHGYNTGTGIVQT